MKLFVCGHGRNGKDQAAEFINKRLGLTFKSSSRFAAETVVMPYLADLGIKYESIEDCYEDRFNHRELWKEAITRYNESDLTRLSRRIFEKYDMYVGIRCHREFLKAKHLSDLSIWIDATSRVEESHKTPDMCDVRIDNNGTLEDFESKIARLCNLLKPSVRKVDPKEFLESIAQ